MDLLPVFMNLHDQLCLVTGGSPLAFQKIQLLLKTGAKIHLHSHDKLCNEVEVLLQQNLIKLIQANLEDLDLRNYKLIISTSDDFESNQSIAALAQKNNTPINVVDQPELCSFLLPSIVDRSPLIVAVSSCGKSPTFSRFIRNKISDFLPESYGPLAAMLGEFRNRMKPFLLTYEAKKEFWLRMIFSSPVVELFISGEKDSARIILEKEVEQHSKHNKVLSEQAG